MALGASLPDPAKKAAVVEAMFDRIAPRYDLLNRLLTFRLDRGWRRATIRGARILPGNAVLDIACGTGDMCELAALAGARVVGLDFAAEMLAVAHRRGVNASLLRASATAIPMADESVQAVTCAFALRNFVAIPPVLEEAARVLAPGGRVALLEVDEPRSGLARRGHAFYFRRVVPFVGGLLSDRAAYDYLPRSAAYLPPEQELLAMVKRAGFSPVTKHRLGAGAAQLIVGVRP